MGWIEWGVIAAGGFIGAILRYIVSRTWNPKRTIPAGTLAVNSMGALIAGVVLGLDVSFLWKAFLISGFTGALTTFSSLHKELFEMWINGRKRESVYYALFTYGFDIGLAFAGYLLSSTVF